MAQRFQGPPSPKWQVSSPLKYTPPFASHPSSAACWAGLHRVHVPPVHVPPAPSQSAVTLSAQPPALPASPTATMTLSTPFRFIADQAGSVATAALLRRKGMRDTEVTVSLPGAAWIRADSRPAPAPHPPWSA